MLIFAGAPSFAITGIEIMEEAKKAAPISFETEGLSAAIVMRVVVLDRRGLKAKAASSVERTNRSLNMMLMNGSME